MRVRVVGTLVPNRAEGQPKAALVPSPSWLSLHVDAGEPGEAIAMRRRVVQAIPLNSAVVETLMRAHIANDDRTGAENVYKEHAAALEQAKLGDPEDSIEQLRLDFQPRCS